MSNAIIPPGGGAGPGPLPPPSPLGNLGGLPLPPAPLAKTKGTTPKTYTAPGPADTIGGGTGGGIAPPAAGPPPAGVSPAATTANGMSPYTWAVALLQGLGMPTSGTNIEFIMSWETAEGGNWNNTATANPLNTTESGYGGTSINSVGVKAYPSWENGLQATVAVFQNGLYGNILALLKTGDAPPAALATAVSSSQWGTEKFNGAAAGSQAGWTGGTITGPTTTIGTGSDLTDPLQQAATPTLSLDALRSADPLVAALVMAIPELTKIFQQAVAGTWGTDQFISAIQNSSWWASHSSTARELIAEQYADPATWQMTVSNLEATLVNFSAQLGATPTAGQINQLAINALMGGYDTNQAALRQQFEKYVTPVSGNHYAGEAGTDEQQLRQTMMQLGIFLPENTLDKNVQQIVGGQSDINSVAAQLRTQAQARYPAYAQQINEGVNTSDIADPYIQQAQSLLEQGPGQMNIQSPLIQQTLTNPNPVSLTDFENTVRQQPAWLQTDNARDSLMTVAHQVLTDFGFMH